MRQRWTDEQLEAIRERDKNLLLSAAAGSGKTAVLIERIVRLAAGEGPIVDIDRLLVVTFTKAAAAEMKGRLRARLAEMLAEDSNNPVLQKQLALLPRASVSTFDSLCQRIVRENFMTLNIDPMFKVGDEEELFVLREQALDDVFEDRYQNSPEFRTLVESVCESADDYALRGAVVSVFDFIQSERSPEIWLYEKAEAYNMNACISEAFFWKKAYRYSMDELEAALTSLKNGMEAVCMPGGPMEYFNNFTVEIDMLEQALLARNYEELSESLKSVVFGRLSSTRAGEGSDAALKEAARELRAEAKKKVEAIKEKYFFKKIEGLLADMKSVYPLLKTLSETVTLFSERYMELKKEKRILSFSDIKLLCYSALVREGKHTPAANEYKKLFEYVLVDEYQDTNDVEEGILDAVSRNSMGINNRFMVGDVKQSIYRFRQSKPELFIEKSKLYGDGQCGGRLITLSKNFRSRKFILNGVNFIFSRVMTRDAAEIEYDESQRLIKGGDADDGHCEAPGRIELALIETDVLPENEDTLSENEAEAVNEMKSLQVEANYIADRIRAIVAKGSVSFGDIVILMRSGKRNGAVVSEILSEKGIPNYAEGKAGYFELTEISDMLALLQIIDNPLQEIPLLTALTSPIFKFTADELIEIRSIKADGYFYDAITDYAGAEGMLSEKCADFLDKLTEYRELSSGMQAGELLTFLMDDTDYFIMAGAMTNGKQRQANLRNLAKRAADFDKTNLPGFFHFVRYMERLKERDMLGQPEAAPDTNVVRIMTIHKSKGLEFPVVFLAGCGSKFNLRDLSTQFILHQELGYGAAYIDYEKRTKTPTLQRNIVKERLRRESLAEEMRLLYVAMTRAKEKLYITGSVGKDASAALRKWLLNLSVSSNGKLPQYSILSARSYMDWLMPAAMCSPSLKGFLEQYGLTPPHTSGELYNGDNANFSAVVVKRSETPFIMDMAVSGTLSKESFDEKISDTVKSASSEINIDKTINWKYNYEADVNLPVKISVSEIKTQYQRIIAGETETGIAHALIADDENTLAKPQFMQEKKGLSPSEKGTAVHSVLANLDLKSIKTETDVIAVMDTMLKNKALNENEYESINISDIMTFLSSEIAARMKRSLNVRREVPFVIGLGTEDVFLPVSGETVLVHGIIDCFFEEDGKIIIVDYKTDYVHNGDFETIKQKYEIQISVYRKAAEKITQMPVSEAYLYMMRYGRLVAL